MFIEYFRKKLGIDALQKEINLLKEENDAKHLRLSEKFRYILTELAVLRVVVKTKINVKESKDYTQVAIEKLEKEIEQIANIFTEEFAHQIEAIDLAIKQTEQNFKEQSVADFKKVNEQIESLFAEVRSCKIELQKKTEPIAPADPTPPVKEVEAVNFYNLSVLDGNYLRALLQNKIPTGYNSSEIKNIPNNYTLETPSNFKKMSGLGNRHCYDNAIIYRRSTNYIIHIGLIFPKQLLQKIFEGKEGLVAITPYLHAWNVTELGKIADYTLGSKRGEDFVYIGRPLVDITRDLEAKDIEQILRNETM